MFASILCLSLVLATEGDYIDSFDIFGYGSSNYGITTNGTYHWIVDFGDEEVYRYWMNGTYIDSFDTSAQGWGEDHDITNDENYLYIIAKGRKEVDKYCMNGTYINSFSTSGHGSVNYGITTDGNNIWIYDNTDKEVYKYSMDGTYIDSFDVSTQVTTIAHSMGFYGVNLWLISDGNNEVYKYWMNGTYIDSFSTSGHGSSNRGITTNGAYFWIIDYNDMEVYRYEGIPAPVNSVWVPGGNVGTYKDNSSDNNSFDIVKAEPLESNKIMKWLSNFWKPIKKFFKW